MKIAIDSINRFIGWTWTHIQEKILEGHPPLAKANSSSAIIFPSTRIGIQASILDSYPDSILRSFPESSMAVFNFGLACSLLMKATTALSMAFSKIARKNNGRLSTKADTFPKPSPFSSFELLNGFETSEFLIRQINHFHAKSIHGKSLLDKVLFAGGA